MNALEYDMARAGYVRSPNKIQSDIEWDANGNSPIWYAGSPGIPEPPKGQEVEVSEHHIRVFKTNLDLTTTTIEHFQSVAGLLDWCRANGRLSEPGLPAFSNSWD